MKMKIDILLASYNGEKYIKQQIESILQQTYKEWKLFIKDDHSTDKTVEIVKEYIHKFPEKIFLIESSINSGSAKDNFMSMLEYTTAEYVMFCDQDDVWLSEKVKVTLGAMKKVVLKYGQDLPALVHGDLQVVDKKLNLVAESLFYMQNLDSRKVLFRDYLVQNNITGCTVMINRALINKIKEIPRNYIMHDWWFALIASAFGKVYYMDNKMIKYRQHENNAEGAKNGRSIYSLFKKAISGNGVKEMLEKTYSQAAEFKRIYYKELGDKEKGELNAYLSICGGSKLKKLGILNRYKFTKSGFVRNLGYYLYI